MIRQALPLSPSLPLSLSHSPILQLSNSVPLIKTFPRPPFSLWLKASPWLHQPHQTRHKTKREPPAIYSQVRCRAGQSICFLLRDQLLSFLIFVFGVSCLTICGCWRAQTPFIRTLASQPSRLTSIIDRTVFCWCMSRRFHVC
jgi:hypothetical protein